MSGLKRREYNSEPAGRVITAVLLVAGLIAAIVVSAAVGADTATAGGPAYSGPQTTADGPAHFGPAPNPLPYCDNPTYFDAWEENVNPTGRLDVGDMATVTTDGITMDLEILSEGSPGEQYPGFFPFEGEGVPNDRAKGFEVAAGDSAVVRLDQPLFYAQFIFTDVDQPGEGFSVIPDWAIQGEVIAYGGDGSFTFAGTTPTDVRLDDLDGVGHPSEAVEGRAQIDMLGAVNGITFTRPPTTIDSETGEVVPARGQSGLAVAGGCEASGAAKRVAAGPTWNGTSYEVTYELRFRNNMPTEATILEVVEAAQANAQTTFATADPTSIPLDDVRLTDQLGDPAFSTITVTDISSTTPNLVLNDSYNGLGDDQLLLDGSFVNAESEALILLTVEYTPDSSRTEWAACSTGYAYLNQSIVEATVGGIAVSDESDDGVDPTPSSDNGSGGVDDPTPVLFPCPPAGLDIVKTVVPGPNADCPAFADGVQGEGPPLSVIVDDFVTYCISVANPGVGTASDVVVTDAQAPQSYEIGTLLTGETRTVSYDLQVDLATPTVNTAIATGATTSGTLGPVSDTAAIEVSPKPDPVLEIVKTVIEGPNGTCPAYADGVVGEGDALPVFHGDTVTYCISVRNSGENDATSVVVSDPQAPGPFSLGELAVGQAATRSYDIEVDASTAATNTATATGEGPNGGLPEVSDTAVIDPSPQPDPRLNIVKTVVLGPNGSCPSYDGGVTGVGEALEVELGDTVTYCVSVRNTGLRDADNVVITDAQAPAPMAIGTLAIGATVERSYDVVVDEGTPLINVATVSGEGPNGELPEDDDDAQINTADIELVHTVIRTDRECDETVRDVDILVVDLEGLDVHWCYRITNTGTVPLTNVTLSSGEIGFAGLDALANQGQLFAISDSGDLELAEGEDAPGVDGRLVGVADAASEVLAPGETISLAVRSAIPGGGLESVADVVADPADENGNLLGLDPVTDTDEAEVREGLIELTKTVAPGADADCASGVKLLKLPLGAPLTWCFEVTNIGTLDLQVDEVVDDTLGLVIAVPADDRVLAPDAGFTVSVSATSTGQFVNVASVEGVALDPTGEVIEQAPAVRDEDTAETQLPTADLTIVKVVSDPGPVPTGTVLTYTLQVTNNGPDSATDVSVIDVLPAGLAYVALPAADDWACSLDGDQAGFSCLKGTDMEAAQSETLLYTVVVAEDVAVGFALENVATVASTTEDPDPTNNTDREITTVSDPPPADEPVVNDDPPLEYPGPFTVAVPPPVDPPDEVLGLAITGRSSQQLTLLALAMIAFGGLLLVGAHRGRRQDLQ